VATPATEERLLAVGLALHSADRERVFP